MPHKEIKNFNPEELVSNFEKCAANPNLPLEEFIIAFEHLILLLNRLGSVFSFITTDLVDKIALIKEKRDQEELASTSTDEKNDKIIKYNTLESMIEYEQKILKVDNTVRPSKSNPPSGSRQFQVMGRVLPMLYEFLQKIADNACNGKTSQMAYEAYQASPLPNFHPWLVRNAVKIAVYTLPGRPQFFKQAVPELTEEEAIAFINRAVEPMKKIYQTKLRIYKNHDWEVFQ